VPTPCSSIVVPKRMPFVRVNATHLTRSARCSSCAQAQAVAGALAGRLCRRRRARALRSGRRVLTAHREPFHATTDTIGGTEARGGLRRAATLEFK
jgi:hypothetical protein